MESTPLPSYVGSERAPLIAARRSRVPRGLAESRGKPPRPPPIQMRFLSEISRVHVAVVKHAHSLRTGIMAYWANPISTPTYMGSKCAAGQSRFLAFVPVDRRCGSCRPKWICHFRYTLPALGGLPSDTSLFGRPVLRSGVSMKWMLVVLVGGVPPVQTDVLFKKTLRLPCGRRATAQGIRGRPRGMGQAGCVSVRAPP